MRRPGPNLELPVEIDMRRPYATESDTLELFIGDSISRCGIINLRISKAAFLDMLFGMAGVPAQATVYQHGCLGKKFITATKEIVGFGYKCNPAEIAKIANEIKMDGWDGFHESDINNGHRITRRGDGQYSRCVGVWKWEDADDAPTT